MTHEQLPRTDDLPALPTAFLQAGRRVAAGVLRAWYDVQVHAMVKREMFDGALGRPLRALGQISVEHTTIDPFAVKQALRGLRDGGVVAVYPEGSRGRGDVTHFRIGAAYLAMAGGAAVVPVTHLGTRIGSGSVSSVPRRGSRVDVAFGQALRSRQEPVSWPRRREVVAELAEELRTGLARHVQDVVLRTGRPLPEDPKDALIDVDGRRGAEVGPQTEEQVS